MNHQHLIMMKFNLKAFCCQEYYKFVPCTAGLQGVTHDTGFYNDQHRKFSWLLSWIISKLPSAPTSPFLVLFLLHAAVFDSYTLAVFG